MGTSDPVPPDRTNAFTATYAEAVHAAGVKHKLPVLDLHTLLQREEGWQTDLLSDGLHFTPTGQALVGRLLIKLLSTSYAELRCGVARVGSPAAGRAAWRQRAPPVDAAATTRVSPNLRFTRRLAPLPTPFLPRAASRSCPTSSPGGELSSGGRLSLQLAALGVQAPLARLRPVFAAAALAHCALGLAPPSLQGQVRRRGPRQGRRAVEGVLGGPAPRAARRRQQGRARTAQDASGRLAAAASIETATCCTAP